MQNPYDGFFIRMCVVRSLKKQHAHFGSDILVPRTLDLRIGISYVRALSVDLRILGTSLWIYVSSTSYFVCARYNNIATAAAAAAAAACGWGACREGAGIRSGARVDSAELHDVCLFYSSCFVSWYILPSHHTNEERRTNTMSGATAFRKQPHSSSAEYKQ